MLFFQPQQTVIIRILSTKNSFPFSSASYSIYNLPLNPLYNKIHNLLGRSIPKNEPVPKAFTSSVKTKSSENPYVPVPKLSQEIADSVVENLTCDERKTLLHTLRHFEQDRTSDKVRAQSTVFNRRIKLSHPSQIFQSQENYLPEKSKNSHEDWLVKKLAEATPKPTKSQLLEVAVFNGTPFVGFGFLDNFFMILFGDYIENTLGSVIVVSTMAAAALGNTLSDVLGLSCVSLVQELAHKFGIKAPSLTLIQLKLKSSRKCVFVGRGVGMVIGCLLGMFPLLFL